MCPGVASHWAGGQEKEKGFVFTYILKHLEANDIVSGICLNILQQRGDGAVRMETLAGGELGDSVRGRVRVWIGNLCHKQTRS